jgi:type VI secretion system ImpM family protein
MPVSCYGKLPVYKDFLRSNLAGREAQAFKQWLDKGVSHYWGERDGYRGVTIYPHGFLLRYPGTARYVIGYLWGSHDEGGLRSFPFSLFIAVPAGREAFPPHSVFEILESVMKAGPQWRQETTRLSSFQDFKRWSWNLTLKTILRPEQDVVSEIMGKAEKTSLGQFTDGLWDDDGDLEWPALLAYLGRHQERIEHHLHACDLAARFPSSDRWPLVLQAQYWTLVIERFDKRRERPVQVLVPAYDSNAGITVLLRNIRPDDVFALHPEMPMNESIEDFRDTVPRPNDQILPLTEYEKQQQLRCFLEEGYVAESGADLHGH